MSVAFLDTETLGLDPDHHPVWDVGVITPDAVEHEFQIKLTDREISLAHPVALEIARFETRYNPEKALEPIRACVQLLNLLPRGTHLSGAIPSFDEERLRRLMWKYGYGPKWHYHIIDVEAMAIGYLWARCRHGGNVITDAVGRTVDLYELLTPPWKSEDLSYALGVDPDDFDRHTAIGDCRWAKAMHDVVVRPV